MIPIHVLRKLGTFDRCWYIVPDLSVLLEDMAFMKGYIFGDDICKLLTPDLLLTELEKMRDLDPTHEKGPAGVAQRYIAELGTYSRQVRFDSSVHCDEAPMSCDEATVRCCELAMVHDMHVVLVTKKASLRALARNNGVYAFTLSELRRNSSHVVVDSGRRRTLRPRRRMATQHLANHHNQHH